MKPIRATFLLFFLFNAVYAQVALRASVDRHKILIGEPLKLEVMGYMPLGAGVHWVQLDSLQHFEIDFRSPIDTFQTIDGKKISQQFTITSFDSGRWQIPPFQMLVDGRPVYSDSLTVDVVFADFDPNADYRDIKDILEMEEQHSYFIYYLLALAALIALILFWWSRRKKKIAVEPPREPELPPLAEAMQALDVIKKGGLDEKTFYIRLNDVLRRYLSRRFGISTFEKTNEELIAELSKLEIPGTAFTKMKQALRIADFVKFAKYRPGEEDNRENLEIVRSSIQIIDNSMSRAV